MLVYRCLVRMVLRVLGMSPSLNASVLRDFLEHCANTATTIANPHLASTGYASIKRKGTNASANQVSIPILTGILCMPHRFAIYYSNKILIKFKAINTSQLIFVLQHYSLILIFVLFVMKNKN